MSNNKQCLIRYSSLFFIISACFLVNACSKTQTLEASTQKAGDKQPNFLLIVADDLGYSDLGSFGGEIGTPNLDALAQAGTQLTNFHTAPTCSPTRSMLMSGTDSHLAGIGAMNEAKRMLKIPEDVGSSPGYIGHLNHQVAALPEVLKEAGYRTYMSGKWHLGMGDEQSPHARGFEKTFTLLEGGAGHLDDMKAFPSPKQTKAMYRENGRLTALPDNFYSTEFYANKLMSYLEQDKNRESPFFAYLAFTAPHWPLQAPQESIARYKGVYDEGYETIFKRRLDKQKHLGLVGQDETGQTLVGTQAWDTLSEQEKLRESKAMEIYAAMVNDMDTYIGKVIQTLKDIGEYDNTVIVFMSDNGADHNDMRWLPGFDAMMKRCCDESYENMGNANSFVTYGHGWARVSGSPTKYFKGYTTQGGILSPAIIVDPRSTKQPSRYKEFLSVMDIMPTFLDLAGVEHPGSKFQDREVLPMKGHSMASIFDGDEDSIHGDDHIMGWELHYHRALRQGDWKIVMSKPPLGDGEWKLYDLSSDPFEHHDLSKKQPKRLAALIEEWDRYVEENNVYVPSKK